MTVDKINELREMVKIQGMKGNYDYSEAMTGMYNGMELMLAVIEGREPIYRTVKPKQNVELDVLITNGYVDKLSILSRKAKGWNFVVTIPAKMIHPHAMETDKATIFSKYTTLEREEDEAESFVDNE